MVPTVKVGWSRGICKIDSQTILSGPGVLGRSTVMREENADVQYCLTGSGQGTNPTHFTTLDAVHLQSRKPPLHDGENTSCSCN